MVWPPFLFGNLLYTFSRLVCFSLDTRSVFLILFFHVLNLHSSRAGFRNDKSYLYLWINCNVTFLLIFHWSLCFRSFFLLVSGLVALGITTLEDGGNHHTLVSCFLVSFKEVKQKFKLTVLTVKYWNATRICFLLFQANLTFSNSLSEAAEHHIFLNKYLVLVNAITLYHEVYMKQNSYTFIM